MSRIRVRSDYERRVPIPPKWIFVAPDFRRDAMTLAAALVVADEVTVLKLSVDGVRIFRIDLRAETVAALCDPPIAVDDARSVACARWAAERKVVLRAREHVVERCRVVSRYIIQLGDRQIILKVPVRSAVPALVNAAVTTNQIMICVVRIDPDFMIVDVLW